MYPLRSYSTYMYVSLHFRLCGKTTDFYLVLSNRVLIYSPSKQRYKSSSGINSHHLLSDSISTPHFFSSL